MARLRLSKDYNGHKKGDVVELRAAEAKQLLKANAASVQTDIDPLNHQTKDSSDGKTTLSRNPHKYSRR